MTLKEITLSMHLLYLIFSIYQTLEGSHKNYSLQAKFPQHIVIIGVLINGELFSLNIKTEEYKAKKQR